ncbi:MAG TPA: hypothetical protein VJL78_02575 [Candidatus Nitrosocosmicus sp.]|nr:hypothetical protein [Candidatus Nitrosocosmicus sp.]
MAKRREKTYMPFDKIWEKWKYLIYVLHKEDRELLLNMYDICRYDGNQSFISDSRDSKLDSFLYFHFITLLHCQKIIKEIKGEDMLIKPLKNKTIQLLISTITFPDYIKN